jgi:hypothetical protein
MESKRYAIVKNNVVENVIMWDGDDDKIALPDEELIFIQNDWVDIGDHWDVEEQRFYRAVPNSTDTSNPTNTFTT